MIHVPATAMSAGLIVMMTAVPIAAMSIVRVVMITAAPIVIMAVTVWERREVEQMFEFCNLHPGLVLILTGIVVFFLPERLRGGAGIAGSLLALVSGLLLSDDASLPWMFAGGMQLELLAVDRLSRLFGLIFSAAAVLCAVYGFHGCSRRERSASHIYAGSGLCVVFAGDWISLICFWEVMAIASWVLVYSGETRGAVRASYRYLVMHLLGGNLLLAGAMILCAENGIQLSLLTGEGGFGALLVFLGICINAGIPPLHTWIPDAYPESTPAGTVYMGSFTTKAAIYALIRFFAGTEELVIWGAVMAVFGACMALIENDLRRLLSYHIVSQLGMMVAALGTGTSAGIDGAALHGTFNILYKGVLLMGAGAVVYSTGKRKITELSGLGRKMPVTAGCFLIASFAISGVPFLSGFASKALIMESLHGLNAAYLLVMLAGVGTWLSITLKINYFVFWGKKTASFEGPVRKVPLSMNLAMIGGTALCVITGIMPQIFYAMTPGGTMGHPFTAERILEYIGLFIGATVPFALLLPKMAPHDRISLDFDWIYRKWFAPLLTGLSDLVTGVFSSTQIVCSRFFSAGWELLKNPAKGRRKTGERAENEKRTETGGDEEPEEGWFEGNMPVGAFMQVFVVFCVIVFIVIMILE